MLPQTAIYPDAQPVRILADPGRRTRRRAATVPGRRVTTARVVSSVMLTSVGLLIVIAIVGMVLGAWRFTVIDTGSMRPTLNPGDVAVLTSEPTTALTRGQIVAFHPPGEPKLTVLHRVFSIHRVSNEVIIQTKGDANDATDQWHARIISNTVWRESLKAPKLGYLAVWSGQRPVRFALLIVIVALLVTMLLGSIWRSAPARPGLPLRLRLRLRGLTNH
jgi:signal peptidase